MFDRSESAVQDCSGKEAEAIEQALDKVNTVKWLTEDDRVKELAVSLRSKSGVYLRALFVAIIE